MPWRFTLLGPLRLHVHGAPVRPPAPRLQPLLAYLALTPEPVTREELAVTLAPGGGVPAGRRRVSQLLFALRRALPDLPLSVDGEFVALPPEQRWVDGERLRTIDPASEPDTATAVLLGIEGELLQGVDCDISPGGEWLERARRAFEEADRTACRETVRQLLARGRDDEAVMLLRAAVARHPFREADAIQLAELLAMRGDRADALGVLDGLEASLQGYGLAPDARAAQLREELVAGRVAAHVREVPGPERAADGVKAAAGAGDFALGARLLREVEHRRDVPPAERRLAAAQLAIAREEESRAESLLFGCDGSDPRVLVASAAVARTRHDHRRATELATEAVLATSGHDARPDDRIDALVELTAARGLGAEGRRALESADGAVATARASGRGLARALLARAIELHRQVRLTDARPLLTDVLRLSEQQGLALDRAMALHYLGTLCNLTGELPRALALQEEEVQLRRDLALDRSEAIALTDLASTRLKLGDLERGLRDTQLAVELADGRDDPHTRARTRLFRAFALHCASEDHNVEALARVQEALAIHREHVDRTTWVEGALHLLRAQLRGRLGQPEAALADTEEAAAVFEGRGEPEVLPRVSTVRALLLLELGRTPEAVHASREAVLAVLEQAAEGDHLPVFWFAHALTTAASGDQARAREHLATAWTHLRELLQLAEDAEQRRMMLDRDPTTRALVATARQWGVGDREALVTITDRPSGTSRRAAVNAPAPIPARPAHEGERGAAGEPGLETSSANGHDVAVRRAELGGLLQQAERSGLRPNVTELARRLGVSSRTIKRDLATLRRRGGEHITEQARTAAT
ncbi:HTH domain-containing protein [Egibacter rhizosphaerae]|uniref:HTH domain-containing protein n=1 Tax=Egibacter rhizosphaerae TaxID=1670831 RepID=A0A411YE03_9ACTN|nr:BTAD domain-containing putative transcriptional regulator [Egibacter rhizosphaerae]QBI19435.1 HTH domain-containing protein [Egibacter rhizosphaerae]